MISSEGNDCKFTIPRFNFTVKSLSHWPRTLTPPVAVVMEFHQHVIHEQVLTPLKALICVMVTLKTRRFTQEEFKALKLKLTAKRNSSLARCSMYCCLT